MKNLFRFQKLMLVILAFCSCSLAWGQSNTLLGENAGVNLTSGTNNVFIGKLAGNAATTGTRNVFIGRSSGFVNTTGKYNVHLGSLSGYSNINGSMNTFLGRRAGFKNESGSGNVFVGQDAGYYELGSNKLYISNTTTRTPLIYGDFDVQEVFINGKLGIDVDVDDIPANYKLAVDGSIIAEEVKVQLNQDWPDYVFDKENYAPMSIEEKEAFTQENKHLPSFAPEAEMNKIGIVIGDNITNAVKELEEAYLYIYQLNDLLKEQQVQLKQQQSQIETMNSKLNELSK